MNFINVNIINTSDLPLPQYQTAGSSGLDVYSTIDITLKRFIPTLVPTGLHVSIPEGYECQVRSRSGMAFKNGITLVNGIGTIDSDYTGEIKCIMMSLQHETFEIKKGDRIAQLVFMPIVTANLNVVTSLDKTLRGEGGFGSTGTK